MSIRKLRAGRVPTVTAEQYIGERGTIFWNEATGSLRLSDGVTLGGISISIDAVSVVTDNLLPDVDNIRGIGSPDRRWNHLHLGDGGVYFDGAYSTPQTVPFLPDALPHPLLPATDDITDLGSPTKRFRNVYLGPASLFMADTITNSNVEIKVTNGTLYLNGAQNLAVGDLTIVGNTIQSILPTTNINLGDPGDSGLFTVGRQTVITTPNLGSNTAALLINGATTLPVDPSPLTFNGTMIHTVAQAGQSSRIVQDAYGNGNYPIYVGRKAGGTISAPTAPAQGELLLRISGNGYGTTGFGTSGSARIDFTTLEQFTDSAKGTRINFWTTPAGTTAITNNASVDNDGFVGTGIRFTGDNSYQTTAGIPLTAKAVSGATYVATLGVDGKLDATQIPSSLTGAIVFKGTWNATTNTPALSDSLPAGLDTGWEYIVEVGGTRDIGDGSKTFLAGDFVIYDGTHWKQVPSGNAFISLSSGGHITVNQTTGVMTLGSDATPVSSTGTIVSRDSSGNFAANVITANLTGNVTGSVSGNAGSVTNGVYTTGTQSIDGVKTFTSTIQGNISGSAGSVTNGVVTTGSYSDPSWLTLSKGKVGLGNVDNTADANKNVLYATTAGGAPATDVYAWAKAATKPTYTATDVGLGNVTNESKATMFTSPTFTGTVAGVTATMVGLGNVTNESKATMFTSPTFTGTVAGVTKAMVGLGSVENTALSTWAGSTNITTVGTLTSGTIGAGFTAIANSALANSSITVNGTAIALGASGTVTAAAGTLTGTTLNSTVVTSSLTSVGTLTNLAIATGGTITTPRIVINDGGLRTISGGTTCTIDFATDSIILWTAPSGTAAITLSNYTAGARVKLIIAMTTSRDITYGISSAALSSTGADNWNGAGAGAVDISNTAVHLDYTCITSVVGGCYVAVTAN